MLTIVPVLEIGGTHVTSALVRAGDAALSVVTQHRSHLDAHADAETILTQVVAASDVLDAGTADTWGVAIPGPFDYERGIGDFAGVGKFAQLAGVDVGAHLREALGAHRITFLNDATAYGIGQAELGATGDARRALVITLGTGVGSCYLVDGMPVTSGPGVPPNGWVYLLSHDGRPLEDHMSRRALLAAHRAGGGSASDDVREIAELARQGDPSAATVLREALGALGSSLSESVTRFGAEVVVVGGSIAQSFDLVERYLAPALPVALRPALEQDAAPLLGTARWVVSRPQ